MNQNVNIQLKHVINVYIFLLIKEGRTKMNKKLSCHCGGVEAQVEVPESGFKK